MAFTPKDWRNFPEVTTPLSAAALENLETRVTDYADTVTQRLGYDVRQYGAVGNGVTDDTTAIQDTIDAAAATTEADKVYFPPGEYLLTASLSVPSFITLEGPTLPWRSSEYGISGTDGFALLVIGGAKNFALVTNDDTVNGNTSIGIKNIRFQIFDATNTNAKAVLFDKVRRSLISECYVFGSATTSRRAFHFKGASEVNLVEKCYVEGMGIYSEGSSGALTVDRCEIGAGGVEVVTGAGHVVNGCLIYCDGIAEGAGYAAWPYGVTFDRVTRGRIISNDIYAFQRDGVRISSSANCMIVGNVITNNSRENDDTWAGIVIAGDTAATDTSNNVVVGNHCYDFDATKTQAYGLRFDNPSVSPTNTLVAANDFSENSVRGINNTAAATTSMIYGNQGVATPTVASGATVTLPDEANFITVSGTANITSLTASHADRRVTLNFSGTNTGTGLTDGSNLKLASNFVYTPADTISLACDGTDWYETGRSVN